MKTEEEKDKGYEEIVDLYLDGELPLDDSVFKMPGIRMEKCIYLLEKEIEILKENEVPVSRVVGYLCIPMEKRMKGDKLEYRYFKYLASILPPVVVCKATAKAYGLDFETLWEVIYLFVEEDVVFKVE